MRPHRSAALFLALGVLPVSIVLVACSSNDVTTASSTPYDASVPDAVTKDSALGDAATTKDASRDGDAEAGAFTVGGQVTGFSAPDGGDGGALVLQNDGSDDLKVAGNGAFTFAKGVKSGGAYAVTVETQPVGQTCAVTAGSGIIAAASVTSVAVACARTPLTISANVLGLKYPGLVVQQNGKDDLTVNAAGKQSFASKVLYGDAYAVTVKTQPTGRPKQLCSPVAGSGIATGNVDVDVACLDALLSATAFDADVTFSTTTTYAVIGLAWNGSALFEGAAGNVAAALTRYDGAFAVVEANTFVPGRDIRSIFAVGTQLYVRAANAANVEMVSTTGAVAAGVTLTPAPACVNCPVVYDAVGVQLLANNMGELQRWNLADGSTLPSTTLTGFGAGGPANEAAPYYDQWIASASGYVLSFASGQLSVWDPVSGRRVKIVTLNGADPTGASQGVTLSYANDHVWVRDMFNGTATWRGYDIGL